jgi:23S rRNA (uracil1939-C5)-methyltransferase
MSSGVSGVEITGLTHRGQGVGRIGSQVVFVPGALPGDRVNLRVTERRANYWVGEISRLVQPSPWRQEPSCSVFPACGGCTFQNLSYSAQLEWKQAQVGEAMRRIGHLEGFSLHPTLPSPRLWGYRNKASFPVGKEGNQVVAGCFSPGTHRIVNTTTCPVQHPLNNLILQRARELIGAMGLSVYQEKTRRGLVRHVVTRVGVGTGEAMAILVTGTRRFPEGPEFGRRLLSQVPGLVSVIQNINTDPTNIVLGKESRVLAGKGHLDDIMGDDALGRLRFRVSPLSFYQVNPEQAVNLYRVALEYAGLTGAETVVDVYTGVGTIALFMAKRARVVVGVDEVGAAIADARVNAGLNDITNVEFIAARAERALPQLVGRGLRADVVVLDPPRAGCDPEVLKACARLRPARLVYVSCYPATLARDLALLRELGYQVREVQPVDMFPMTPHVETVCLMSRVGVNV